MKILKEDVQNSGYTVFDIADMLKKTLGFDSDIQDDTTLTIPIVKDIVYTITFIVDKDNSITGILEDNIHLDSMDLSYKDGSEESDEVLSILISCGEIMNNIKERLA